MHNIGFYFDLDGALINSEQDLFASVKFALGDKINTEKPFREVVSLGSRAMLMQMTAVPLTEQALDTAQQSFLQYYAENINTHSVFYAGLDTMLLDLQKQKIPHAIVTNKSFRLSEIIMQKLLPQWQGVIIGDRMEIDYPAKPAPDRILRAIELTKNQTGKCYYFGDYPSDIEAAKRAGCYSVALRFGFHESHNPPENWGADAIVDTPQQLVEFINNQH